MDVDFSAIATEFELPTQFPAEVEQQAATARDRFASSRIDARDLPLVTIDPPGALDLDQAVHIARTDAGYLLSYAIADVGAFIEPGSELDREASRRGQTIYLPDGNVPLHPRILAEQRASLVAGEDRPAVLWEIETDAAGLLQRARVRRALVQVRQRLDYEGIQDIVDRDVELPEAIAALPSFGEARASRAVSRGAIELQLPAQQLTREGDRWRLRLEPRTRVDAWNAECSLATGIAAATCMIAARVGIVRTLPRPTHDDLARFEAAARAFGIDPTPGMIDGKFVPGALLAALPAADLSTMALHMSATKLLRGSGYAAFGLPDAPLPDAEARWHAGVAHEYAHVTAPIRRLVDRYGAEVCLQVSAGEWFDLHQPVIANPAAAPAWVLDALPQLPKTMGRTSQLANAVNNACLNLAEATALQHAVGETFAAGLMRPGDEQHDAEIFAFDPPVVAQCRGEVPAGERIRVVLEEADVAKRRVRYRYPAN